MHLARKAGWQGALWVRDEGISLRGPSTSTTGSPSRLPMQAFWPKPRRCEPTAMFAGRTAAKCRPLLDTKRQVAVSSATVWFEVREAPPMSSGAFRWPREASQVHDMNVSCTRPSTCSKQLLLWKALHTARAISTYSRSCSPSTLIVPVNGSRAMACKQASEVSVFR